ncbi:substrate-binding domain-containing protein [Maribius pontilimi]|uniref:Substrate-binding domain-containing protein n=1 Tax=Palleronia pontilimi TaxID=1964209 RepID=A0A934IHJ6_9RHOB|nr:substrate-binding domain-containing protein [Palleronia pontilimi]MBJ3763048.1 substrate-binding domain-containing protein [Palleronia pontilimi]
MNLRELSHILGLSQTTVSRALNGYPEVSEATRIRVQTAAIAHNYRPNARAQGLATGRARAIAHVLPMSSGHEVLNPVFAEFIGGAGEVYARADYDMLLSIVPADQEITAYRTLAARRSVDGVMVHAPLVEDRRIALLSELGLPFVVHGRSGSDGPPYAWLDMNNRRAFARGTAHLLDLGHLRIALLNGLERMDFALRRKQGYLDALAARGIAADPALHDSAEMSEDYGFEAASRMLALPNPPTAFLTSSLIVAIGARRACQDRGLVLGRDISIVTHDDDLGYFRNGRDTPYFTALRSPMREHGRRAAEMLLAQIVDPGPAPRQQLLEAEFLTGQSCGPAPGP